MSRSMGSDPGVYVGDEDTRPGPGVADAVAVAHRAAGLQVDQAAVVRPGDTLVLVLKAPLTDQQLDQFRDAVKEHLHGVEVVFVESIAQALVYRPDSGPPSGHMDVAAPGDHRPVYVSTEPGHDPHGCQWCNPTQNPAPSGLGTCDVYQCSEPAVAVVFNPGERHPRSCPVCATHWAEVDKQGWTTAYREGEGA